MITQLKFENFRILRDATLPLGRVTVIIGPNGSGKSTALAGLRLVAAGGAASTDLWRSVGLSDSQPAAITIDSVNPVSSLRFEVKPSPMLSTILAARPTAGPLVEEVLRSAQVYSLDAAEIAKASKLEKTLEISEAGGNLASVLTSLQDQFPERFESLNLELSRWMPEFDRILLDTVANGQRAFVLRTASGKHRITARHLSQGSLIAVALLTLSYLPSPPAIIGLEEVDRGIHPRLLRDVQDAVNRLAFPENFGDDREPVQVVMTTHSPYFVDLFRDHPEDIVIAEKDGLTANFKRLVDLPNFEEILRDAHLGEAWFSGVLGGVPVGT